MGNLNIDRLLLVRDPWATLILSGKKSWEVRGETVSYRGTIAIAKSGQKPSMIYGLVDVKDCIGPLSKRELADGFEYHQDIEDTQKLPYSSTYAWVLENPRFLKKPVPYTHKNGWVKWGRGSWQIPEDDLIPGKGLQICTGHKESLQDRFVYSALQDLEGFGYYCQKLNINNKTVAAICPPDYSDLDMTGRKKIIRAGFELLRDRNNHAFKEEFESIVDHLTTNNLLANDELKLEKLNPVIEVVKRNDSLAKSIHHLCRSTQKVPSSRSLGKAVDLLIWHEPRSGDGTTKHLIGAVGVGSPGYSSGGRDKLFGWNIKSEQDKAIKDEGLRSLAQVNCLVAYPPYDKASYKLTKLLAMSVFSEEAVSTYKRRYGSQLWAAVTTSGYAGNVPFWERISLNALIQHEVIDSNLDLDRDQGNAASIWKNPSFTATNRRRRNHYVFYAEANVEGPSLNVFSNETLLLARQFSESSTAVHRIGGRVALRNALKLTGIRTELLNMPARDIYIGILDNDAIRRLQSGDTSNGAAPFIDWGNWVKYWAKHKAIAGSKK